MPDFDRWTPNGGDPSLNELNRVDRFLDALGSKGTAYSTDHAEAELAFLLADWRDEVRDTPVTTALTTSEAASALRGEVASRKRGRTSFALVGSVAAAVLCIGGFGAAVFSAGPGDAFYGMRTTLFGQERPSRDDAVILAAQAEMQQVQQLIEQGDWQQAQDRLVKLSTTVQSVETPQQKQELVQQYNELTYKVVEQDPAAALPPPDQPQPQWTDTQLTLLPVPAVDATTTETTTSTTDPGTETTDGSPVTTTTPGPEIMLTPPGETSPTSPTSPLEGPSSEPTSEPTPPTESSSPTSSPSSPTPTTTAPPTTTTTTTAAAPPAADVTSLTPAPQAPPVAEAPAPATAAPAGPAPAEKPSSAPATTSSAAPAAPTKQPRNERGGQGGSGGSDGDDGGATTTIAPAG